MKFLQDSCFVGREMFLETLHTTLLHQQKVVLTGKSSIGKTTAIRKYVQQFAQEYQSICYLNASTDETLLADLLTTLQTFALPIDPALGVTGLFQALHTYLNAQQHALLILDHLPDVLTIQKVVDQSPTSYRLVLITQTFQTKQTIATLELPPLDVHESALLVLRQARLLTQQATLEQAEEKLRVVALELAREAHGWPLALNLAGNYLHMVGCSMRDYLDLFRSTPVRLHLPESVAGDELQEIAVTCELTLTWLEQAHPQTCEALQICALLLPEAIPDTLFESISPQEDATEKQNEILQILLATGLVNAEPETSTLNIHPLVQQLVCQFFSLDKQPQQQKLVEQALRMFHHLLPVLQTESLPKRLRVVGHIQQLAKLSRQWRLSIPEAAEVFYWAASLLWEQRMLKQAEILLRKALSIWERTLGTSHPTVATLSGQIAILNGQLKNYTEAEAWSHRAIANKMAALGVNHPEVLQALDQLGQYYAAQGKHNEARACYEKVISMGEQFKLRLHPVYSAAKYHLAQLYIEQEEFAQAEELLRNVCVVWKHQLGANHPSTVAALLRLAEVAAHLEHWERADTYYSEALPLCTQILGKEHPVTLKHREHAARVSRQLAYLAR